MSDLFKELKQLFKFIKVFFTKKSFYFWCICKTTSFFVVYTKCFENQLCNSKSNRFWGIKQNCSHFFHSDTANIYSQYTAICCVTFSTVIWLGLSQPLVVHMTVTDFEEYSLRLSAMFGCNMCSQITAKLQWET